MKTLNKACLAKTNCIEAQSEHLLYYLDTIWIAFGCHGRIRIKQSSKVMTACQFAVVNPQASLRNYRLSASEIDRAPWTRFDKARKIVVIQKFARAQEVSWIHVAKTERSSILFIVAIQPGRTAAGSQGPLVNNWVSASSASMPHLAAVDR